AAAAAGARWFGQRECFLGEGLAVVRRLGDPDLAIGLAAHRADLDTVPGDVDVALVVGGHAAAAVEQEGLLHQVALLFECLAAFVQPAIEHGSALIGRLRHCLAGAVPGYVDSELLAERDLTAADGADRDRTAGLTVDAERFGKAFLPRF